MAMDNRQRELIIQIGPFTEWDNKKDTSVGIELRSNGDLDSFKIRAAITKTKISVPNQSTIAIWNLKRETYNALNTSGLYIRVYSGYQLESKELLFSGSIESAVTVRNGADFITRLTCYTGKANLMRSVTSKTYDAGILVSDVVQELADQIPGVTVDPSYIDVGGEIGYNGWSFNGSTREALDKLANAYGFSWTIENDIFVARSDDHPLKTGIYLDTSTGLMNVSPRLSGPTQIQVGVDVNCKYVQGIRPGQLIRVNSSISKQLNGDYEVHTVEYSLSPKENAWDMSIEFFKNIGSGDDGQ